MNSTHQTIENLFSTSKLIEDLEQKALSCFDEEGEVYNDILLKQLADDIGSLKGDQQDNIIEMANAYAARKTIVDGLRKRIEDFEREKRKLTNEMDYFKHLIEHSWPSSDLKTVTNGNVIVKKTTPMKLQTNETEVTDEWKRPKYKDNPMVPDKDRAEKALKAALKSGNTIEIPGFSLGRKNTFSIK